MPEDTQTTVPTQDQTTATPASPLPSSTVIAPPSSTPSNASVQDDQPVPNIPKLDTDQESDAPLADAVSDNEMIAEVAEKVAEAHNILIALSADPSVDEISAAIGLSLCLDRIGKRATAIYSGSTPNALEFLKPEETFESTADTLQDFVIALNKEKADHLRYKLDGDFVKIFITPYKTRIDEEDLEFSYGDFNVDLVLALDVANGVDLDSALREHGRIMHDATVINITTGNPGKLGEIEWSDKTASSVSEMVAKLLYGINKMTLEKEEATAFLTGIVAATNRFSKANTTPETMKIASRLMESGADQQLISKNITPDMENEIFSFAQMTEKKNTEDNDPTKLSIGHGKLADKVNEEGKSEVPEENTGTDGGSDLLDDLKATEEILSHAGAETTPEKVQEPLRLDTSGGEQPANENQTGTTIEPEFSQVKPEKVITPNENFTAESLDEGANKYGQMLEEALAESGGDEVTPTSPIVTAPEPEYIAQPAERNIPAQEYPPVETIQPDLVNPAMSMAPNVETTPEINGVPEMNYMPMPGEEILPPPPTPPIDFSDNTEPAHEPANEPIAQSTPQPIEQQPIAEPTEAVVQPPIEAQPAPQPADTMAPAPDAFKIPGM